jgi:Flp pilus assembly protein TadG
MVHRVSPSRRGVAAVELAAVLPFLAFVFVIGVDWSRLFYCSLTVEQCARNGAFYASDPYNTTLSPYADITSAALADASNLTPQPTVSLASGSDGNGAYADCTVSYTFQTITNFPGVPSSNPIVRTVRVYLAPNTPQ